SDLAGYDPTRTLGENFWENAGYGGFVGSLVGWALGLGRRMQVQDAQRRLTEENERRKNSGDLINSIEGAFTPVEQLVALREIKRKLDEAINAIGEDWANANIDRDPLDVIFEGVPLAA